MKNNAPRRKLVEDAIDLYTPSIGIPKEGDVFISALGAHPALDRHIGTGRRTKQLCNSKSFHMI